MLLGCGKIPMIKKHSSAINNTMWTTLVIGQVVNAGNMNYQQESGYYEINPLYGKHPPKGRIYITKAGELLCIYGITKLFPKWETEILTFSNGIVWGFIFYDNRKGIEFKLRY